MLHDLGKYSLEFRNYIIAAIENPDNPPKRGSVDHATAGGKLLYDFFHTTNITRNKGLLAEVVGNAIISHHSYLHDFIDPNLESKYLNRVRDKELPEFNNSVEYFFKNIMNEQKFHQYVENAAEELGNFLTKEPQENSEKVLMYLTKYIFSALIDADRTNTRQYEENQTEEIEIDSKKLFTEYNEKLTNKLNSFKMSENAKQPINILRSDMSDQCQDFASKPSGIYTLSIPTGGGKTLASLRYALNHSLLHDKKRIIYVVPFTTIIEQNAADVRGILADNERILEHHSNVIEDESDDDESQDGRINTQQKLKLAKDNWDVPIIFTTMVQFLNVFYAKGTRNIRRLHNLTESVIIFDEVQKVPTKCVSLFNEALNFLKLHGKSSMLLCTATQPTLNFVERKLEIDTDAEIIDNLDEVNDAFKRVEIIDEATDSTMNNDGLAEFIKEKSLESKSILVVLNTKTVVKRLYESLDQSLNDKTHIYHLSTSMCAAHRNNILKEIKYQLKEGESVICLSTQLIEAGVDISFDSVIRSMAGLDSIAQAAGRCNRHGEADLQHVYVIDHEEENLKHLKEISEGKKITRNILKDLRRQTDSHGGSILSHKAMERYFEEFYSTFEVDLDYFIPKLEQNMITLLTASKREYVYVEAYKQKYQGSLPLFLANSYRTAAENFQVIDNKTTSVIVPYQAGEDIIAELNGSIRIDDLNKLMRKAQHYTVNLYTHEIDALNRNNAIVSLFDDKILALNENAYNDEYGLDLEVESGGGFYHV
ncbi:CRISPR-associated helicase, Cas3 family [Natribacillus halophilus]|uniref:CRISPR-associated helicase, Cas3 family n=1 Tax=Natribacillus halophilus TaxID=549003 RepID=A0A1G8SSV2_9BACI|nr:CRISPR-associated helicase, Cas3 family [Natribacillus halophilus]